jgi:integrase
VGIRIVYVVGKASRRSGPRHRAVPLAVKAARALDGADAGIPDLNPHAFRHTGAQAFRAADACPRLSLGDRI